MEHCRGLGRTTVTSNAAYAGPERDDAAPVLFATRHGFQSRTPRSTGSSHLPVADALLDEVEAEGLPHRDGYTVETFVDGIPDELLPSYCALVNKLVVDAPSGEVDYEEQATTPDLMREHMAKNVRIGRRCSTPWRCWTARPSRRPTWPCSRRVRWPSSGAPSSPASTGDTGWERPSRSPTSGPCRPPARMSPGSTPERRHQRLHGLDQRAARLPAVARSPEFVRRLEPTPRWSRCESQLAPRDWLRCERSEPRNRPRPARRRCPGFEALALGARAPRPARVG